MKKTYLLASTLAVVIVLAAVTMVARAQSSGPYDLNGWAWSSNTGWISFNSAEGGGSFPYNVQLLSNGDLSGYAWSSNIGWIKFGGLSESSAGVPSNFANAWLSTSTGAVTGYARACAGTISAPGTCSNMTSRNDGWDGWIALSGTNHVSPDPNLLTRGSSTQGVSILTTRQNLPGGNTTATGTMSGYAWGDEVNGWISFMPTFNSSVNIPSNGCPPFGMPCNGGPVTLTTDFGANPFTGPAPLNDIILTSTVTGGTATGNITYQFKCKSSDAWSSPIVIAATSATYSCSYPTATTTLASGRVIRQGITVDKTTSIVVTGVINSASVSLKIGPTVAAANADSIHITQGDPFALKWVVSSDFTGSDCLSSVTPLSVTPGIDNTWPPLKWNTTPAALSTAIQNNRSGDTGIGMLTTTASAGIYQFNLSCTNALVNSGNPATSRATLFLAESIIIEQ